MPEILNILLSFSAELGYWGIVALMTIESSFVPFPSEIVIPPAAYLAAQGQMNIWLVILAGLAGSLIGAMINYVLARSLGRTIVYSLVRHRYAKWLLLSEAKLENAEAYFRQYGSISTFVGRLIPAVRQLISIPAGFARMRLDRFLFFTGLGAGLWTVVLAVIGYFFGAHMDRILEYFDAFKHIVYALLIISVLALALYIWQKWPRNKTQPAKNVADQTDILKKD